MLSAAQSELEAAEGGTAHSGTSSTSASPSSSEALLSLGGWHRHESEDLRALHMLTPPLGISRAWASAMSSKPVTFSRARRSAHAAGQYGSKLAHLRPWLRSFNQYLARHMLSVPCSLTLRSSGAPTAGHQGPACGTWCIFTARALASRCRRPLSSNVRLHKRTSAALVAPL